MELRLSNMVAAKGEFHAISASLFSETADLRKAISDAVRTSLGPRGMDKMVRKSR